MSENDETQVPAEPQSEREPTTPKPTARERAKEEVSASVDRSVAEAPEVSQLPFSLVRRHDKKTVQLLANSGDDQPFDGRRIWFTYEFEEPVFVERIDVFVDDYGSFTEFEFACRLFDGKRLTGEASPQNGRISRTVNRFVHEISFRPPRRSFSSGQINEVRIYGFAQSEVAKFGEFADKLAIRRDEVIDEFILKEREVVKKLTALKKLEDEKDDLEAFLNNLETEIDLSKSEIRKLTASRDETVKRIEGLNQSVRENEQKIEDQKNSIGEASDVRSKLARSIIDKQARLRTLTDNINLFPSELSDFVSQGSRDVKLYAALAFLPITVIVAMFAILVEGGVDLTTRITGEENVNILAILVSRMPFVIVAVTIITACYYLARMFVLEMVRVNRQKLSLSKIGIIAKDISYATDHELELSEEEKQERRLRLKMDMLRDHLKDYLSKDFEPSLPKRSPFEQMRIPGLTREKSYQKKSVVDEDEDRNLADESERTDSDENADETSSQ